MNNYNEFKDLPLTLTASDISEILNLSKTAVYRLLKQEGFPVLQIGNKKLTPRNKFIEWMEKHTGEIS